LNERRRWLNDRRKWNVNALKRVSGQG
jgi:hypothetical protein